MRVSLRMQTAAAVMAVAFFLIAPGAAVCGELADGVFEKALDARQGLIRLEVPPAFAESPLTFESRVRIEGKEKFNIIAACLPKSSPAHWELFTLAGSGKLAAYFPGRKPDHARTECALADGKWHHVAMVSERDRVRLFVNGSEAVSVAMTPAPSAPGASVSFAIGGLVEGNLACAGYIDESRISKGARPPAGVPEAELDSDADTLGLWHFNRIEGGEAKDASPAGRHGRFIVHGAGIGSASRIPRMPTAYQPLPAGEDVAPAREALQRLAIKLELRSIDAGAIRDAVYREWLHDFACHGRIDYPEHRKPWYQNTNDVSAQTFDGHALIHEGDGGPAGTVLRRASALAAHLAKAGAGENIAAAARDLDALRAVYARDMPAPDSPEHKACYLAACALRRRIAFANPLLGFDGILCVARGTFAGSVRSNPATQDSQGGHFATQYFGCNALPGGGIFIVRNFKDSPVVTPVVRDAIVRNGRLQGRKLDHGAFATPDLSFDGKSIAFAWTDNREHVWSNGTKSSFHLFRAGIDGGNLVQLTDGPFNDFDPCWLPDGRIGFISERRGGHIRCFAAYLKVRNYTLFSMKPDGGDIRPLSYFETSEWNPTVSNDGRIVFTRWDYTDRENCLGTRIWFCRADGSDPRAPHGNYPHPYHTFADHAPWGEHGGREIDSRIGAPLVEMGIRAVPNSPLYVFTAAPHHGEVFGSLCVLDLRRRDDGHMSQIRRITPDEPFPETESSGRRHYKYGTPWPLSEDFHLCNVWENLALVDRYGNKELVCELDLLPCARDERLRLIDPIPIRPRPVPPAAAPAPARGKATIAVMNVYDSDLPFPPETKIKWLRVTQNILKANHAMGEPMIGYERENTPRIPLGIVPVEEDGSAYFEAPVAKELIFQVLDADYRAVQSMRSVAFVHPGEQLACQGCHESAHSSPSVPGNRLALLRSPSKITPEIGPVEPISYYRQIRPIFEGKCVRCHAERKRGPRDMSYEALKEGYTFWFSGAMYRNMTTDYSGIHGGSRTIPGRFGARNSRIGRALFDETHREAISAEDRHKVVLWLDSNSLRLGSYVREAAQLRGELVWPELDVDPANVLGVEDGGAPLQANFWHENAWGPRPILVSSHTLDKVCILDKSGAPVWDYALPHPQDVWLLANGNILTTHLHGVREVTRDRKVVWAFDVESPNEVPSCQPLPDGRVLVGVVGQCRIVELDRKGTVVFELPLSTTERKPHAQFRMCRKTPEGTYLVPFTAEGAVREYASDGRVLREFPRKPTPVCAIRLDDGNTLISAGGSVTEYDPSGRVFWELTAEDIPDINIAVLAGIQRLPNGNTVVCNWNTRDADGKLGAHVFEVTPDKRVVWHLAGRDIGQVAQCQLLNSDLSPRADPVCR